MTQKEIVRLFVFVVIYSCIVVVLYSAIWNSSRGGVRCNCLTRCIALFHRLPIHLSRQSCILQLLMVDPWYKCTSANKWWTLHIVSVCAWNSNHSTVTDIWLNHIKCMTKRQIGWILMNNFAMASVMAFPMMNHSNSLHLAVLAFAALFHFWLQHIFFLQAKTVAVY